LTLARQVRVEILGDARGLRRAFSEADRASTGFAKGIAKTGLFAATGLAGIAAGIGVAATKSIQAAQESNKVAKQTEAVLKSTGNAAKVTAKQVSDLATTISNKTGIDDEQVQASENMLLTFTNIRNATGKNNDIFTQATKITQDMSVALGQDGTKSAIQLGKALNDPVKGITALQRVGVTFTQQQRDQIKTLVDSGHTMEAQKVILRELGKEFGGSAEAAATPLDKLKVIVGNVSEAVGNILLPIVNKAADWLGSRLPGAVSLLQTGLHALGSAFRGEGVTSTGFVGVMEHIGVALRVVIPAVQRFAAEQLPRLQHAAEAAGKFIAGTLVPALLAIFRFINSHKTLVQSLAVGILAIVAAIRIWTAVTRTMAAVQAILNVVLSANPIGLIILAIVGLAAGLIYAYKHSETFRRIVTAAFHAVWAVIQAVWNWVKEHWPLLFIILTGPIGAAVVLIIRHWSRFRDVALSVFRVVVGAFLNLASAIINGAARAFGWVPGLGGKLRGAAAEFNRFRDSTNRALHGIRDEQVAVAGRVSLTGPSQVLKTFRAGPVVRMAAGGLITQGSGPTADDVLGRLSRGEFVLNAKAVQAVGVGPLQQLNAMRFADGGLVPHARMDASPFRLGAASADRGFQRLAHTVGDVLGKTLSKFLQQAVGGAARPPSGTIQQWAMQLLSAHGWASQWAAFSALEMSEAGWNPRARNPSSGALGLAQALGHGGAGTAGTLGNEYGGFGLTAAAARLANSGDAWWQLVWMMNYIAQRWGSPAVAWGGYHARGNWYKRGGLVMDAGGWLAPGWNPPLYNGTGRPERVGGPVILEIRSGGSRMDDLLVELLRNAVRVRGGNVQLALGNGVR
jgi:Prophage tail length tape measure protein